VETSAGSDEGQAWKFLSRTEKVRRYIVVSAWVTVQAYDIVHPCLDDLEGSGMYLGASLEGRKRFGK
jgi:hypothetical protein